MSYSITFHTRVVGLFSAKAFFILGLEKKNDCEMRACLFAKKVLQLKLLIFEGVESVTPNIKS